MVCLMDPIKAIILGVVQGLTEFLPVSSSGHLVLFQHLFGLSEPELLLDICLHLGTLAAICVVFFREILAILSLILRLPTLVRSNGGLPGLFKANQEARLVALILAGSLPTALLGLLFHEIADRIFGSVGIVGLMLLITGTVLWSTRLIHLKGRSLGHMTVKDSLLIGLAQGLAVLPGISRSGATISTALFLGIDRELAGRYSFLLSIPAIAGALVVGMDSPAAGSHISAKALALGTGSAAVVGYLALQALLKVVRKGKLHRFAPYCWIVGVLALGWSLV